MDSSWGTSMCPQPAKKGYIIKSLGEGICFSSSSSFFKTSLLIICHLLELSSGLNGSGTNLSPGSQKGINCKLLQS